MGCSPPMDAGLVDHILLLDPRRTVMRYSSADLRAVADTWVATRRIILRGASGGWHHNSEFVYFGVPQSAVGWQLALPVYITYNGVSAMAIIVDKKYEDESRNHLAQKLEDMTFLQADDAHTVAAMQAEFDSCNGGEHGNARTHLELLKMKHKGLVTLDLSTITTSAKAALIATNIAHTVAAAAQASGTTPAPGLTIASGNSASTQAITLAPTYLMHLAVEEWDRIEAEKKRNTPLKSRKDTGVALSAQSSASSSSSQSHSSRSARTPSQNLNQARP
ncbi:hypothetical protein B0H14DRAFT_3739118 [Mycena olivaceomarginata]|nr:hypothetical protein B0H14DRAFT_3739118 [Mycena olivaceomarginata]